jgi:hypothetical protein
VLRIVSGYREELRRAHHDLPLIAFFGMSQELVPEIWTEG